VVKELLERRKQEIEQEFNNVQNDLTKAREVVEQLTIRLYQCQRAYQEVDSLLNSLLNEKSKNEKKDKK